MHENDEAGLWACSTPATVDWRDRSQMPFSTPRPYVREAELPRLRNAAEVACRWLDDGLELRFTGRLVARVRIGDKPGEPWLAARPGPLAKPLAEGA